MRRSQPLAWAALWVLAAGGLLAAPKVPTVFQVTVAGAEVSAATLQAALETQRQAILRCDGSGRWTTLRLELEVHPDGTVHSRGSRSPLAGLGPLPCVEPLVKKLKVKRAPAGGVVPFSVVVDFDAARDKLTGPSTFPGDSPL